MRNTILRNQMDVHFEEMTALLDFDVQKYITSLQTVSIINSIESPEETNVVSDFWDHVCVDLN